MVRDKNRAIHSTSSGTSDKIIIYAGELEYLSKCITESPYLETGGNIFGVWTPFGLPMVQYVVGPGPHAFRHATQFRQDIGFLEANADKLVEEHALHHIGTWHSHHSLGLAEPSGGDTASTLDGMRECGLQSFVLMIGNYRNGKAAINAFRYFSSGERIKLRWVVLPGESPYRKVYDRTHPELVYRPSGIAELLPLEECRLTADRQASPGQAVTFDNDYWLSDSNNRKEFAAIVKYLKSRFDSVSIFMENGSCVELRISDSSSKCRLRFDKGFPHEAPKIVVPVNKKDQLSPLPQWNVNGNKISEAVINLLKSIEI